MYQATRQYIQMITSALATQTDVKIYESDKWAVDAESKTLFYDVQSLKTLPFYVIKGVLLHEVSHLLHTETPVFRDDYVKRWGIPVIINVYNPFEDFRIEKQMVDKFGDYAQNAFAAALVHLIEKNLELDLKQLRKIDQFLILSFIVYTQRNNIHGSGQTIEKSLYWKYHSEDIEDILNSRGIEQDVYNRFNSHRRIVLNTLSQCRQAGTTQEVIHLVDRHIIPLVQDYLYEDKKERDESDAAGEGDQGKGQMKSMTSLAQEGDEESRARTIGTGPSDDRGLIQKVSEQEAAAILKPYINTLSQRLQSILQEKAHTKWRGSYISGKLLNKSAYKVMIPDETRMFSKKTTPDVPHYHIYLALDASGSMSEGQAEKGVSAYMGAVLLKQVCANLKFKLDILHYDTEVAPITDLYKQYSYNGGGTNDYSAMEMIEEKIDAEENNLIFFLTDGETDLHGQRADCLSRLENKFNAYVFGIGIGDDISRETIITNYKRGIQVSNVQELPQRLVEVIRSVIRR